MQHKYQPTRLTKDNSILTSRFSGHYYKIQCSCGLFGVGITPSAAMEHINQLHEGHHATLLFFNTSYLNLEESFELEIAI